MEFLSFEEFFHSEFTVALYCERVLHGDNNSTTHSGMIIKPPTGGISVFHFAWHQLLKYEQTIPRGKSIYIGLKKYTRSTDIGSLKLSSFFESIELVYNAQQLVKPAYGLQYSTLIGFDGSGLINLNGSVGLTCSTFILAFFKRYDKELVDISTWEPRLSEDSEWKDFVIKQMEKHKVEKEHIEKVRNENVIYRFKPEEVVSAGINNPMMSDFTFCSNKGKELIEELM